MIKPATYRCVRGLIWVILLWSCQGEEKSSQSSIAVASPETSEDRSHHTKLLTADSSFTSGIEGPAVSNQGDLYAVNYQQQGTIGKVSPDGQVSIFVTLPDSSVGNGIRFTQGGDMLIADYVQHNILRIDKESKEIRVWVHEPRMNQPNDIAITSGDIVFASDPNWSASTGQLWRIDVNGNTTLLEENMGTTNGLEVSPDETILYVNESVQRKVWAYDLSQKGEISNKRLFIDFEDYGMDGMRCDQEGNLYITRYDKGSVVMVSPQGEILHEYRTKGMKPSNIAFGGPEGKTCYVTMADRGNIEVFMADYPGRSWALYNTK